MLHLRGKSLPTTRLIVQLCWSVDLWTPYLKHKKRHLKRLVAPIGLLPYIKLEARCMLQTVFRTLFYLLFTVWYWVQGEKVDPEKLRLEREELERRQKEGQHLLILKPHFCVISVHFCMPWAYPNQLLSRTRYWFLLCILSLEKARLQAEAKAAEEFRRKAEAEAAAEAKRKRELDREAARQALLKVRCTAHVEEVNYNLFLNAIRKFLAFCRWRRLLKSIITVIFWRI